jgi:hypothetical protein
MNLRLQPALTQFNLDRVFLSERLCHPLIGPGNTAKSVSSEGTSQIHILLWLASISSLKHQKKPSPLHIRYKRVQKAQIDCRRTRTMPHTPRRRKLPLRKRIQVADEDGWTHITTSGVSAHRAIQARDYKLLPAEPPLRLTIGELKKQYETHRQRWRSSSAGDALDSVLRSRAASSVGGIDRIICIGLGSLSGFVGGGWVDRRSVSLYQLAALESVIEFLGS